MVEVPPLTAGELATTVAAAVVTLSCQVASGLLHRSGTIRIRHWVEETGGRLRDLHRNAASFEAFRHIFAVVAQLAALLLFAAIFAAVARGPLGLEGGPRWAIAFVLTATVVGFNDIVVRRIVAARSEAALERLTPLYRLAAGLSIPFVAVLRRVMPKVTTTRESDEDEVSEGKLDAFIEVGQREGILEAGDGELVRGVIEFGDTQVRSVMTPRVDVVCARADAEIKDVVRLAVDNSLSRIPIYEDSIDHIVGVVHSRDLLRVLFTGEVAHLRDFALPPHFVPQTKRLAELLKELQERHQALAIVVDEYGGTEGIVTLEDILEEIFGEIVDEHDSADGTPEQQPDGSWLVGGQTHIEELDEIFDVRVEEAPYETVGGLIFGELGRVPLVGDAVRSHGLEFVVETVHSRRVQSARVRPLTSQEVADDES